MGSTFCLPQRNVNLHCLWEFMVTVLNIFALWFGLGGLFTAALLWVCIAARRSRDRAELPMNVSRIAAAAAGPKPHRAKTATMR